MADKRCSNGHFIDEAWDLCPYCPPQQRTAVPSTELSQPSVRKVPTAEAPRDAVDAAIIQHTVAVQRADASGVPAAANRYVVGWLVGLNGSIRGESFALRNGRNVLGRDRRSDVFIADDQASSHHADLVYRPDERRYLLMDHNSTNGTFLNGVELEQRRDLAARDLIKVGSHIFLFVPLCDDELYWDGKGPLK